MAQNMMEWATCEDGSFLFQNFLDDFILGCPGWDLSRSPQQPLCFYSLQKLYNGGRQIALLRCSRPFLREQTLLNTLTSPAIPSCPLSEKSLLSDVPREGSCMSEGSVLTLRHWPTLQGLKEFSLAASPFLQLVALVGLLCLMEGPTRISVKSCL